MIKLILFVTYLALAAARASSLLFSNGAVVSDSGAGAGGADASVLRDGLTVLGYETGSVYGMADEFTVPAGESWNITRLRFFGYQTFSGTASTLTTLKAWVWDGRPWDAGAARIWGSDTDNILTGTGFTGVYRVSAGALGSTDRPIMYLDAAVTLSLSPGTYWMDWTMGGSLGSYPQVPPVTVPGQMVTGNARGFFDGSTFDLTSNGFGQGVPFEIHGVSASAVPEPGSFLVNVVTGSCLAGAFGRRRRRMAV